MQAKIEQYLLHYLQDRKRKIAQNNNNGNDKSSTATHLSFGDVEDWIVLDKLHQVLTSKQTISQRALYYSLPHLYKFGNNTVDNNVVANNSCSSASSYTRCTSHIDRLIERINIFANDVAEADAINNLSSSSSTSDKNSSTKFDLGLTSTGKSLLFSSTLKFKVRFHENNNNINNTSIIVDLSQEPTGHVLSCNDAQTCHKFEFSPSRTTITTAKKPSQEKQQQQIRHILLIVEKEAVARQLVTSPQVSDPSIMKSATTTILCTKGYPCLSSRLFLENMLHEFSNNTNDNNNNDQNNSLLEICFVVDCDPHGLAILMSVCGILNNSSSPPESLLEKFSCPNNNIKFKWVALKPSLTLNALPNNINNNTTTFQHRMLPWNLHDAKCMKTVMTSLDIKEKSFNTNNNNTFIQQVLLPEARLMNAKQIKLELECLREELICLILREIQ